MSLRKTSRLSLRSASTMACGALLWASLAHTQTATSSDTHDSVSWQGKTAHMRALDDGSFLLRSPQGERRIPAPTLTVHTASPLFDGLFAMAQDDLRQDSVAAIRDGAFDHGESIACACFETGEKWHYVWTRDLSYAVDLALWRIDPVRSRQSLRFKLSEVREPSMPQGLYVMQDTGSGGSWPISTDRVVWFLGARHLLDDPAFADESWRALTDTLAQDRRYVFDEQLGLYRGETSFLDWREQSYPDWTAKDVRFISESYALSTNVLHYQALQLAASVAEQRHDALAPAYRAQADALKRAINAHFWRADRGMYMSYVGAGGMPIEAYDLLGLSLAITSGVADPKRARQALANYPAWSSGSPVIWPERADQPIYHNRAIWPFVSAYALRAARSVNDAPRIAHEMDSLLRGAALSASNMENFELATQSVHVEDGALSGPVVDSPRQLWSVAGYLDMVISGVFGVGDDGSIAPKLPVSWLPQLFGDQPKISLDLAGQRITLVRPESLHGDLLVAKSQRHDGNETVVELTAIASGAGPLRMDAPLFAPATPAAPVVVDTPKGWQLAVTDKAVLYIDGRRHGMVDDQTILSPHAAMQCLQLTTIGKDGLESLPSAETCKGTEFHVDSAWPREWKATTSGKFRVSLAFTNDHGPINTGITAAVKLLEIRCDGAAPQRFPLVLPHSDGEQRSTSATFTASAGALCRFRLDQGFNMSFLRHNAHYTGGQGGADGPLNDAAVDGLLIAPVASGNPTP